MVIPQLSSATEQVVRTRRLPKNFNDLMWILVVCEADASHGSFLKIQFGRSQRARKSDILTSETFSVCLQVSVVGQWPGTFWSAKRPRGALQEIVIKKIKKSFDSFQNHFKNFSQVDWKVSHTNKVQKLLLF
jgi:hypothetical protein